MSPFPDGWYFVTDRAALRKKTLIERAWLGQEVVAWRDEQGSICVADAYCPHLGSHLGPKTGGKVRDGCLVCPFHGFEYDVTGRCVATPLAPAPRNARLAVYETQEINGMVFAWWSASGRPPDFRLPTDTRDGDGWTELGFRRLRVSTRPEYITENAVDLAHFSHIHGYSEVEQAVPVTVDGAHLTSTFEFTRERSILGWPLRFRVSAVTHVYGLGYSMVELTEQTIPFKARFWFLAIPVDGTYVELVLANQTKEIDRLKRRVVGLGWLPRRIRARLTNYVALEGQVRDVAQDITIWTRRTFHDRPVLSSADGKIMLYRRYCSQFYRENASTNGQAFTTLASPQGTPPSPSRDGADYTVLGPARRAF